MENTPKSLRSLPLFLLLLLMGFAVSPSHAQKRIYIAPDDHTDYMWTADEATYQQSFLDMLDYYLALADSTAGNPSPYQSRWNCDGSFWLWTYQHNKSQADFDRLMGRVKDGHISAPMTTLVGCYGGTPAEAVLRGLYYSGRLERQYNTRFPLAVAMENQVLPYGLGSLWAGAGAKWSWRGVCDCATSVPNSGDRENEIYYWTGPDNSRILMKWNSLYAVPALDPAYSQYYPNDNLYGGAHDKNQNIGGYAEARYPFELVTFVDSDPAFTAKYTYPVIGAFGEGWDYLQTLNNNFVVAAQMMTNANRQVIVSNEQDFFQDFETNYGSQLPTVAATFGNEWELASATLAEVSAGVKRSTEKLRSAEALATLVSFQNPTFMDSRTASRDQAFVDFGLYWEHDFVGGGPVSNDDRIAFQRRIANGIQSYVDTLYKDASTSLGGLIKKTGTNLRFYAFNPLSWTRTDAADYIYSGTTPVHVIEVATGTETPSQIVTVDGIKYLRVLASNVPSVGYKVYEIVPGAGAAFTNAATVTGSVVDNGSVKLTINNGGAITSYVDKTRSNREFAKTVNSRKINDMGVSSGTAATENVGPVSVTYHANSTSGLAHDTRITVYRNSSRVDIRNDVNQNFNAAQTNAFSFNLTSPDTWYEEVGAVIRAKLLADGGHYSPRNARCDWQTMNHFADMTGTGNVGVTVSNGDCYYMKVGNSSLGSLDTTNPQINALIGGQTDSGGGLANQGGDTHFRQRFALRTHDAYDPVSAMKFALEHQNPLVVGTVRGGTAYPEGTYSALTISDPNVLLWALKPAEEGIGSGTIARVWNLGASASTGTLSLPQTLLSAKQTTHIETDLGDTLVTGGALNIMPAARQIQTYRLNLAPIVTGTVTLEGYTNPAGQPVTLQFRPASGTTLTRNVTLDANGAFRVADVPADNYTLLVKGAKWLQKAVSPLTLSVGSSASVAVTLPVGDASGDNAVNFDDFLILLDGFSPGYDASADFNGDGTVNFDDFLLLLGNFGTSGDS